MSTTNQHAVNDLLAERKAMRTWVGMILFLLFGSIGMWIYAAVLAVSDPSMAIVPDYHEKALRWDEQLAIQQASQKLHWTTAFVLDPQPQAEGGRNLTLFLRDQAARPVEKGNVRLRYYHHARAKDHQTVTMKETSPGTYEAIVAIQREGTWQLELQIDGDHGHFESSLAQDF